MFRALAPRLRARGWRALLPLIPGEKRPAIGAWQQYNLQAPSEALITAWCAAYADAGIGLAAGPDGVLGVDLDFLDPPIAKAAAGATREILGLTPLIRQGRLPKRMEFFQLAPATIVPGKAFGGFELFTRSGQAVLFGIHPETRCEYQWIGGATPLDIAPTDLPIATGAQIGELIRALSEIAASDPTRSKRLTRTPAPGAGVRSADPLTNVASDRTDGSVASVAPLLRAAPDPFAAAADLITHSAPGDRHPTMLGAVMALASMGFSDEQISDACHEAYVSKFAGAGERAADFERALVWARDAIGPDAETIASKPWAKSLSFKWRRGC